MSDSTPPATASAADRAYFARVARANAALEDAVPPATLLETLARMDALREMAGAAPTFSATRPGSADADDLQSHLVYLRRMRERRPLGAPSRSAPKDDGAAGES